MKIGVIADDFTGASDIALTLAEGGMRTAQFIGVPDAPAPSVIEAGVVALKTRTCPIDQAVETSRAACDWLIDQGATQIIFKVCSTFDSTDTGNIGPVLDALAARLNAPRTITCPAFPENGRSVYQGHLFVKDTLLNESGMQDHPLTPMRDADLRRVLARQSQQKIGHVPALTVLQGADAIKTALPATGHTIVDAIRDDDLMEIGKAVQNEVLLCGGSGIALGLPVNFGASPGTPDWQAITGPGAVLSGSCSIATRAQVTRFKAKAPNKEITAEDVLDHGFSATDLADWALAQPSAPLIYSSADPSVVRAAQDKYGQDTVAHAIEALFSDLAKSLVANGLSRLVVAGGETSGAVVSGLKVNVLQIGPRLAPGVPALRLEQDRPIALALKSGNFGDEDFFASALARMEGNP